MEINCPPPSDNYFDDFITRCPCYKIPYLSPLLFNDKVSLTLKCECSKLMEFTLSDYIKENKNIFNNIKKCNFCGKTSNFYCIECKRFLCADCKVKHDIHKNDIINNLDFSFICFEHKQKFNFFCENCKKNICNLCEHNNHNIYKIKNLPEELIINIQKQLNENKKKLDELKNIIERLNNKLNQLYNLYDMQFNFLKQLYNIYDDHTKKHKHNYHIGKNLEKFYQKVYDRHSKINYILKKTKDLFELLNNSNKRIKNIKTKGIIKQIELLNHGNLGFCCENSAILSIVQSNNFETQNFQTKKNINYFTQLKNDNIIICYNDKSMEIISIGNDTYEIIQSFESDLLSIQKIIELNQIFLSFTSNNEIQIWEKNNEKYEYSNSISFNNHNFHKFNVFKINNKKFLISIQDKQKLEFYNDKCLSIGKIPNINIWIGQNICMLNNDILCYGGSLDIAFYLIDINNFKIIKSIKGPKLVYSITKNNYGIVIASVFENNINKINYYKYSNNDLIQLSSCENNSKYFIFYLIDLSKGINAYGNVDSTIQIIVNF